MSAASKITRPKAARPARARTAPVSKGVSRGAGEESRRQLEQAALEQHTQRYLVRLFVTGTSPASSRAIEEARRIFEKHLQGRYDLEVVDIHQMPALAKREQLVATPTLIKTLPLPVRRFIGDLSNVEELLFELELREKKK